MGKTRIAAELVNNIFVNQSGSTSFTGSLIVSGSSNIIGGLNATSLTGSLNYINLTGLPTLVSGSEQIISILNPLNSHSESIISRTLNLENKSASVDISIANINSYTSSNTNDISNLHSYTSSLKNTINVIGQGTSSVTTIYGNLVVEGTTITVSASNLAVADNMIYLNDGNTITDPDLGIAGNYNDGTYSHAGFFSDASDGHTWKVYKGYTPEPSQSIDITHGSFTLADFQAGTLKGVIAATNGVVSGSSQITFSGINSLPTLVSGSSQVNVMSTTNITRLATTGSNEFNGNQIITGSLVIGAASTLYPVSVYTSSANVNNIIAEFYNGDYTAGTKNHIRVRNSVGVGSTMSSYFGQGQDGKTYITSNDFSRGGDITINGNNGEVTFAGNVIPKTNNSQDLGSATYGWRNVYTNDLHLSNEGKPEGNDIDGTTGNWTIQEGEEHLYIINNKTGKKFKFSLEEIK